MTRPISMLKKWIAPLHVYDFTEKTLHYLGFLGAPVIRYVEELHAEKKKQLKNKNSGEKNFIGINPLYNGRNDDHPQVNTRTRLHHLIFQNRQHRQRNPD